MNFMNYNMISLRSKLQIFVSLLFLVFVTYEMSGKSKPKSEVLPDEKLNTFITTGEGKTTQEATTNALKAILDQAFGCFVSSNTTIIDDELVKDELVSVSSGNIKKYNVLGSSTLESGAVQVTVEATVSVTKLTSFAQSKGSACELDGNIIVQNIKLNQVNAENGKKVMEALFAQIMQILPTCFTPEISDLKTTVSSDGKKVLLRGSMNFRSNENLKILNELVENTLRAISPENADGIGNQLEEYYLRRDNYGKDLNIIAYKLPKQITDSLTYLSFYMNCGYYVEDNFGNRQNIIVTTNSSTIRKLVANHFKIKKNLKDPSDVNAWVDYYFNTHVIAESDVLDYRHIWYDRGIPLREPKIEGPFPLNFEKCSPRYFSSNYLFLYTMEEFEKFKGVEIKKEENPKMKRYVKAPDVWYWGLEF